MGVTSEQMHAFARACELAANTLRGQNGIGSLGEKTLHLALKYFYEPKDTWTKNIYPFCWSIIPEWKKWNI